MIPNLGTMTQICANLAKIKQNCQKCTSSNSQKSLTSFFKNPTPTLPFHTLFKNRLSQNPIPTLSPFLAQTFRPPRTSNLNPTPRLPSFLAKLASVFEIRTPLAFFAFWRVSLPPTRSERTADTLHGETLIQRRI
jgi:hypothetical protein